MCVWRAIKSRGGATEGGPRRVRGEGGQGGHSKGFRKGNNLKTFGVFMIIGVIKISFSFIFNKEALLKLAFLSSLTRKYML